MINEVTYGRHNSALSAGKWQEMGRIFQRAHRQATLYSNARSSDCLALMELAFNDCKMAEKDEFRTSDITL